MIAGLFSLGHRNKTALKVQDNNLTGSEVIVTP